MTIIACDLGAKIRKPCEGNDSPLKQVEINSLGLSSREPPPDPEVSYRQCRVRYSAHAIGGLSKNHFICAAKLDTFQFR